MKNPKMEKWNGTRIREIDLGEVRHGIKCQHPLCERPYNPKRLIYEVDGGRIIGSCCIRRGPWVRLDIWLKKGGERT